MLWSTSRLLVRPAAFPAGRNADFEYCTPGYFQTMGIPLLRGRGFDERDTTTAPRVAVVNATFARTYLGVEPYTEPVPVLPTAHYAMGGIPTNNDAQVLRDNTTVVNGLYAAGECACVSIQPGMIVKPVRSYVVPCAEGSILTILPSLTTIAVFRRMPPLPSKMVAPLITTGRSCAKAPLAAITAAASGSRASTKMP